MIDGKIKNEIRSRLAGLEQDHGFKIIYACESGSRAWGFPSPDSDYDVRFVYIHPLERYLSIDSMRDTVDIPIDNNLDIGGWDIKKVLYHVKRSNPVMFEWPQSPIVYRHEGNFKDDLLDLYKEYFCPRTSLHHYLGIAGNAWSGISREGEIKIKKIFYVLRPLLSALWIAEKNAIPPMELSGLMTVLRDETIVKEISRLLEMKKHSREEEEIKTADMLRTFINSTFDICQMSAADAEAVIVPATKLDDFFMGLLKSRELYNEYRRPPKK